MRKYLNVPSLCECGGELAVVSIQVDFYNCDYSIMCDCIVCGEPSTIVLGLTDFIELDSLANGKPHKPPVNLQDEQSN